MEGNITFPQISFLQNEFLDFGEIKAKLGSQSRLLGLDYGQCWFKLSNQINQYTYMKCSKGEVCSAYIKFQYQNLSFKPVQMNNIHDHVSKYQAIKKQIKSNYLIAGKISGYHPSKPMLAIFQHYTYKLEIGSSCITNPGLASIAYSLRHQNQEVLRNCCNIGQKTNNEAQFICLIWGLVDCLDNGIKNVECLTNNSLVVNSMGIDGKIKAGNLLDVWEACKLISKQFSNCEIRYKKRIKNDYLSQMCKKSSNEKIK